MIEDSITLYPNGKINLGLIIKGKRPDGYHLLETVYIPVYTFQDRMEISRSGQQGCHLEIEGNPIEGPTTDNLIVKAYHLLKEQFPSISGVSIQLKKIIPMGAGLGGGSSNAAFTLKGLNTLFQLNLKQNQLAEMGSSLGADVPFFVYNSPLFAKGIGTEFEPIDLDWRFKVKIIKSDIHSSTVAAYKKLDLDSLNLNRDLRQILAGPVSSWKENLTNDLERPIFQQFPELKATKEQLYNEGAVYAAMSGSGSAVYGLFEKS